MPRPRAKIVRSSFGLFVAVYAERSPADADWDDYLEVMREIAVDDGLLIFSWGGGPTFKQRRELEAIIGHHRGPVAVITDSVFARGIVKAIGWTGKHIKSFAFARRDDALDFLGLDPDQRRQALVLARDLAVELELDSRTRLAS